MLTDFAVFLFFTLVTLFLCEIFIFTVVFQIKEKIFNIWATLLGSFCLICAYFVYYGLSSQITDAVIFVKG